MTTFIRSFAIPFALTLSLILSNVTVTPSLADPSQPQTVPRFKNKKSAPIVEAVTVEEESVAPKRTTVVRRRRDKPVPPKPRPSDVANQDVLELAKFGSNEALPEANAIGEIASSAIDGVETSSVILDQDQPPSANISAASSLESAADVDELAQLKAEVAALKAQLAAEKKKTAELTIDLVREKSKPTDVSAPKKDRAILENESAEPSDVEKEVAETVSEPESSQIAETEVNSAEAEPVSPEPEPVVNSADVNDAAEEQATEESVATTDQTQRSAEDVQEDLLASENAELQKIDSREKSAPIKDLVENNTSNAAPDTVEQAETTDGSALSEAVPEDPATLVDATSVPVTPSKSAAEIAAEAGAEIAKKDEGEAVSDPAVSQSKEARSSDAKEPLVDLKTDEVKETASPETASQIDPADETVPSADEPAEVAAQADALDEPESAAIESAEPLPEETEIARAPDEATAEPLGTESETLEAADQPLVGETGVAAVDPALLLPRPRENPFPRVVPKVSTEPLYIKRPPVNDTYNVFVLGDSLGSGLWQGLHQNFRGEVSPTIKIVKKAKANTGIVRSDRFDWMNHIEKIAAGGGFQIAVMMFGANDAQTIREKGKRHHFRTPAWEQIYRQRIDRMVRALKRKNIAIYWVGLPNVRVPSLRKNYVHFNAIFKEKAEEHGFHFIETWDVTNDASGNWQSSGKTVTGRKAVLRSKDGTHFTSSGYRVLAQFPELVLRPDIEYARSNRLAGSKRRTGTDG